MNKNLNDDKPNYEKNPNSKFHYSYKFDCIKRVD